MRKRHRKVLEKCCTHVHECELMFGDVVGRPLTKCALQKSGKFWQSNGRRSPSIHFPGRNHTPCSCYVDYTKTISPTIQEDSPHAIQCLQQNAISKCCANHDTVFFCQYPQMLVCEFRLESRNLSFAFPIVPLSQYFSLRPLLFCYLCTHSFRILFQLLHSLLLINAQSIIAWIFLSPWHNPFQCRKLPFNK